MTSEDQLDMTRLMSALKMLLQGPTKENVDTLEELLRDDFNTAVTDVNDIFAAMDAKQKVQVHMDVSRLKATIRDVEITFDDDFYETVKMAYSFFSGITHSNLKSAEYSVRLKSDGGVEVPTGGIIKEKDSLAKCLFAVICGGLIRSLLISSAVFSTDLLQKIEKDLSEIQKKLNELVSQP